ncbi:MAG: hypothetical protein AAB019_04940, partial [Planctomycetota bacterium]
AQPVKSVVSDYDHMNNRTKLTYPSGKTINYQIDELNRVKRISESPNNLITQYTYIGSSRILSKELGNGVQVNNEYDANRRLKKTASLKAGVALSIVEYKFDQEDNNLYEKQGTTFLDVGDGNVFKYDSLYRLTGAKYNISNTLIDPLKKYEDYLAEQYTTRQDFNLDNVGARQTVTNELDQITTYTINNLNQYTHIQGPPPPVPQDLQYDFNGNLKNDGEKVYEYDYTNRLIRVTSPGNPYPAISYRYDALGRQIVRIDEYNNKTAHYYYDDGNLIGEYAVSSPEELKKEHVFGAGDDVEQSDYQQNNPAPGTYYLITDGKGNVISVFDNQGTRVEGMEYDAFMKRRLTYSSLLGGPVPHETDISPIGNNFTGNRIYDQAVGLLFGELADVNPSVGGYLQHYGKQSLYELYGVALEAKDTVVGLGELIGMTGGQLYNIEFWAAQRPFTDDPWIPFEGANKKAKEMQEGVVALGELWVDQMVAGYGTGLWLATGEEKYFKHLETQAAFGNAILAKVAEYMNLPPEEKSIIRGRIAFNVVFVLLPAAKAKNLANLNKVKTLTMSETIVGPKIVSASEGRGIIQSILQRLRGVPKAETMTIRSRSGLIVEKIPGTAFGKSIKSLRSGSPNWQRVSAHAEGATGSNYRGATSIEEIFRNIQTGEQIVRHRIVRGES